MLERLFLEAHGNTKVKQINFWNVPDIQILGYYAVFVHPSKKIDEWINYRKYNSLSLCFSFILQSYLWNDNKSVVEWLEKELSQAEHSVIDENVKWISRDWILRQIKTWVFYAIEKEKKTTTYLIPVIHRWEFFFSEMGHLNQFKHLSKAAKKAKHHGSY